MIFKERQQVHWAAFPEWETERGFFHGFSTRKGGVSDGQMSTLNLGYSQHDTAANVRNNRRRFYEALNIPGDRVVLCRQIHSANVSIADKPTVIDHCDGLITNVPELYLVIGVADCHVVFLTSQDHKVVSVLHAGWRGTARHILDQALLKIKHEYQYDSTQMEVGISPGIGSCCYEVGEEVAGQFPESAVAHRHGNIYLDLAAAIGRQAEGAGVPANQIYRANECTSCNEEFWFSYRRDNGVTGRMWGVIAIREED